jgi:ABC-type amino acid transport substrate-binding protein
LKEEAMYGRRKTEGGESLRAARRKAAPAALMLAAALLIPAAQVVGARRELKAAYATAAAVETAPAVQSGKLTVGVTDSGFTPSEATADPGLVHLTLENSGSGERVKLRVAKQGGPVIRELEVAGRGGSLATELDVAAGEVYTLTEADHGWVFRLTVGGEQTPPAAQAPPDGE